LGCLLADQLVAVWLGDPPAHIQGFGGLGHGLFGGGLAGAASQGQPEQRS
jgi:hypothetical protein